MIAGLILAISTPSIARDYKVEVILFENSTPSSSTESHDYKPPQRMTAGSKTWRLPPSMLLKELEKIEQSSNYEVKHHYSWGVESLPYQNSANYTVAEVDAQGYIKVYADNLLFTNIDLDYNGFRMKEKRRLKLNEKHFFDHPKFGLLMQVSRLEPKEDSLEPEDSPEQIDSLEPTNRPEQIDGLDQNEDNQSTKKDRPELSSSR